MIINPELGRRANYNPPLTWTIYEPLDGNKNKPHSFPTVTIQCDDFEEFKRWFDITVGWQYNAGYPMVMSRQPNPWLMTFAHGGPCGGGEEGCIGWVPISFIKDEYLCAHCREQA